MKQLFKSNKERYQENWREKYNTANIFLNRTNTFNNKIIEENKCTDIVEVKEKSFLHKVFERIKNLFNRK